MYVIMLKTTLLCLVFAWQALGAPESRIVNGVDANPGEIPYIVSIRANNRHGCGGSILNDKFVLTAAHCVYNWVTKPELFSVQYGVVEISEKTPNVLPVEEMKYHENYVNSGGYPNDIALIKVMGSFDLSLASPVGLPTPFQNPMDFEEATLAGWGLDKSGGKLMIHLQKVIIEVFPDQYCQQQDNRIDSDVHYCAGVLGGGKGQCTGDSGGPLVIDGTQFGVVSWSQKPCASPGHPGVFTRLPAYRDWIRKNTGV